ncbi:MAG TPA: DinB family protein [Bacteroidia bacterium]|nr:DinB family protein [Bacteroidia bacterium]
MNKQTLQQQLLQGHTAYANYVLALTERDFNFAPPEKWNAGEHLNHILISISKLNRAINNPKYVQPIADMQPQRALMSYDTLVDFYLAKIKQGAKATAPFVPELVPIEKREQLVHDVKNTIAELCAKLDTYSEEGLDLFTIPHPLLGTISIREMLYFTIKHAEHHYELTKLYIA